MDTITIVTVCKNAGTAIGRTIDSVTSQDVAVDEYIVIDGKSTDNTLDIVMAAVDNNPKLQFKVISECDKGIYNAMNKALRITSSSWVLFLNAGDELSNRDTVRNLRKAISEDQTNSDFIYGNAIYRDERKTYSVRSKSIGKIAREMPFCHQCVLNRTSTMREYYYDEKYRICADYNLYMTAYLNAKVFLRIDKDIAIYETGGYSQENVFALIDEIYRIRICAGQNYSAKIDRVIYKIKATIKYVILGSRSTEK
ncbi:MAG: glycosyltransferase family 2 protein [Christensenellaceae bacterium]